MSNSRKNDPRSVSGVDRKIGARIRARRLEINMSQSALADAIGVTFQQIQKYEKGVNRVAAATLMAIAKALAMRAAAFLPEDQEGPTDGKSMLDDPGMADFVPLLADLNIDGRRTLAGVARTFAQDPKLRAPRRRRFD